MNNAQITAVILDDCLFSDIFKEIVGFRPRGVILDAIVEKVVALQKETGDDFLLVIQEVVASEVAALEAIYTDEEGPEEEPAPDAWRDFVEVLPG